MKIILIKFCSMIVLSLFSWLLLFQDPVIRPLVEQDTGSLLRMMPEIPLWVKNPDYDRVCHHFVSRC